MSENFTKGQRKDPPDKGTVSVKPGSAWLREGEAMRPQSHWPAQRRMSLVQVSFLHYLVVASQIPALNALASESYFDFAILM